MKVDLKNTFICTNDENFKEALKKIFIRTLRSD